MTATASDAALADGRAITPRQREGLQAVWVQPAGWRRFSEINNTVIGVYYMLTALGFLFAGGVLALLIRLQLAVPDNTLLGPDAYNQVFTMHGTTMMFLFAVPAIEAVAVYLLPQMLGARDLPFPRLSAFGYWCYLFGGTIAFCSLFAGIAPDGGWFMYTPLTTGKYSPGINADVWLLGIGFIEISAISAAVEIVVGVLRTRAPGMSLNRMPLLAWSVFVAACMILFGFPPMLVGDALLELQRALDLPFFEPARGGDPLLWQHLFWLFGHPEVYIIFLPAAGIVSTLLPTFCGRPLAGYRWAVVATIGVGFISFSLWVHHMFTTGLPQLSLAFFSAASLLVVIPNGIQFFCWIATMWSGRPRMQLPMLYLTGFFSIFLLGGLTGVMVAVVPFDWQAHDTYFVVAHLHYVLIGGMVFPLLAGLVYWLPAATGRLMHERSGKWAFWLLLVGFNVAFLPMHWTGLIGMPRRVYTYGADMGWTGLNLVSTVGAFVLAAGFVLFAYAMWHAVRHGARVEGRNPWKAGTLEWTEELPMRNHGFTSVPIVRTRYPLWEQPELPDEVREGRHHLSHANSGRRETIVTSAVDARPDHVLWLPGPTHVPMLAAALVTVSFVALTFKAHLLAIVAGALTIPVFYLWAWRTDLGVGRTVDVGRGLVLPAYVPGPRSVQHNALVVSLAFDLVSFGALVFSYLYLFTVRGLPWPPRGQPLQDVWAAAAPATGALVLLAAGVVVRRLLLADRRGATAIALLAMLALQAVTFVALLGWLRPLDAASHAYAATVWVLGGYALLHLALAALMLPYLLLALGAGRLSARQPLAMQVVVPVSHAAAVVTLLVLALVTFFPRLVSHG